MGEQKWAGTTINVSNLGDAIIAEVERKVDAYLKAMVDPPPIVTDCLIMTSAGPYRIMAIPECRSD